MKAGKNAAQKSLFIFSGSMLFDLKPVSGVCRFFARIMSPTFQRSSSVGNGGQSAAMISMCAQVARL
jgi:hypothetical protein